MHTFGWQDFLVGFGVMLVLEGLIFAGVPEAMRRAMTTAQAASDQLLRGVGFASAIAGLLLIWLIRH